MREQFTPDRGHHKRRFRHRSDGTRLIGLGIVLLALSIVALADLLAPRPFPGHFGGSSAIFGGVAVALHIIRIARPEVYLDWILSALFYVGAGLMLCMDENHASLPALALFCLLLCATGVARMHIGLTAEPRSGAAWIFCSGVLTLLGAIWIGSRSMAGVSTNSGVIVAVDSTLQGISIVAFGLTVRDGG